MRASCAASDPSHPRTGSLGEKWNDWPQPHSYRSVTCAAGAGRGRSGGAQRAEQRPDCPSAALRREAGAPSLQAPARPPAPPARSARLQRRGGRPYGARACLAGRRRPGCTQLGASRAHPPPPATHQAVELVHQVGHLLLARHRGALAALQGAKGIVVALDLKQAGDPGGAAGATRHSKPMAISHGRRPGEVISAPQRLQALPRRPSSRAPRP